MFERVIKNRVGRPRKMPTESPTVWLKMNPDMLAWLDKARGRMTRQDFLRALLEFARRESTDDKIAGHTQLIDDVRALVPRVLDP